jgi:hypothetical protein
MSLPGRGLTLVFNGEVFNYVELRDGLKAKGRIFRTGSDTEVILHLYEKLGEDCVSQLNGDFAFAIWDAARKRIFFARDRMGVCPLYYTVADGTLYFASEVKALLEAPGVSAKLDSIALDQIFTLWAPIAARTPFRDIYELEPGDLMIADENGLTRRPYWFTEPADRDEASAAEELRWLLTDATRIRVRADIPIGSYLGRAGLFNRIGTRPQDGAWHFAHLLDRLCEQRARRERVPVADGGGARSVLIIARSSVAATISRRSFPRSSRQPSGPLSDPRQPRSFSNPGWSATTI